MSSSFDLLQTWWFGCSRIDGEVSYEKGHEGENPQTCLETTQVGGKLVMSSRWRWCRSCHIERKKKRGRDLVLELACGVEGSQAASSSVLYSSSSWYHCQSCRVTELLWLTICNSQKSIYIYVRNKSYVSDLLIQGLHEKFSKHPKIGNGTNLLPVNYKYI